jgi:hypothetical protein
MAQPAFGRHKGSLSVDGVIANATYERLELADGVVIDVGGAQFFLGARGGGGTSSGNTPGQDLRPTLDCKAGPHPPKPEARVCSGGHRAPDGSLKGAKVLTGPNVDCTNGPHVREVAA